MRNYFKFPSDHLKTYLRGYRKFVLTYKIVRICLLTKW